MACVAVPLVDRLVRKRQVGLLETRLGRRQGSLHARYDCEASEQPWDGQAGCQHSCHGCDVLRWWGFDVLESWRFDVMKS
jgi:hypothetical protein